MTMQNYVAAFAIGLLVSCAPVETSDTSEPVKQTPSPLASATDIGAVRALLLARHARDLPSKSTLDHHHGAAASLRALARTDSHVIVRARALTLLGVYPDADSERLLVAVLADETAMPKLRAAALSGLAQFGVGERTRLRGHLLRALHSEHVQIGVAAAAALRDVSGGAVALRQLIADPSAHAPVRRAASRELAR